ncbi:P-loop containing nucleoside triphosphate hydrolase protein [Collybia nuda]|uniref:P-loop containing nucleoside triphosphate hydrolase protein n=1 Tax=Collybia nuda TaxID=64659 RepID=A0A9P5YJJ9_9AGAR|nr:P-loop containing nucleoside triphosphate hydrolase protein [Collybia nuda]
MGPTGAGKSSFIAKVTGGDVRIGHDLQSCTTDIKIVKYECPDKSDFDVVFVDTPGFDDTERSDVEILEMIADWLNKTYERKIILAGILYFHRISDNRMAGTPLKNLKMFRELCGKNALQNIILTTTMWDEVDAETGARREAELRSKYWKAMIDHGSATARFHSTQESAWDIVDHFVRDSNARHAVLLQNEMSEMKKQLPETNAGQKLYTELEVLVHRQQATLKKIREETKQHADPAEYAGLRTQLATVVNDMESMKLPLGKRILRLIWGPMFGSK